MTAFLVFPRSVAVQGKSDDPETAILHIAEQATATASARTFEFCLTRDDLQRLRDDITVVLSKEHIPG
jgi:hypothetical protein